MKQLSPIKKSNWPFCSSSSPKVGYYVIADDKGHRFETDSEQDFSKFFSLQMARGRVVFLSCFNNGVELSKDNRKEWPKEWHIWSATKNGALIDKVENCAEHVRFAYKLTRVKTLYGRTTMEVYHEVKLSGKKFYAIGTISATDGRGINFQDWEDMCRANGFEFYNVMAGHGSFSLKRLEDLVMFRLSFVSDYNLMFVEISEIDDAVKNM